MERFFCMRKSHITACLDSFSKAFYSVACRYLTSIEVWKPRMPMYAAAVYRTSGLLQHIWGFVDGTIRRTCRPVRYQELVYTRHKKCHGIKFQAVVAPDGFFVHLYGPVPARRHDSSMLTESELLEQLEAAMPVGGPDQLFALYADLAYAQVPHFLVGFRNAAPGSPEAQFNASMSSSRIAVEWLFNKVLQYFPYLDYRRDVKIFQNRPAMHYINGIFLTNLHTATYGGQASEYFTVQPLSVADYFNLVPI
jgi:hypothetical protein